MIVKNAEPDLQECLTSVRGAVNEIIVADTGSTDSSIAVARAAGARVISIPWENDFAKARNLSLAEVKADWVLILDADERLDPAASRALPELITEPGIAGYLITIRNYVLDPTKTIWDRPSRPNDSRYPPACKYPAYVEHENVRLFRRHPDIYFTGRVHETVGWRLREIHEKLGAAIFSIHHFGTAGDERTLARKIALYRDLGLLKLADMPANAQAHFEAGIAELENLGGPANALPHFERACTLDPQFGQAWFFAAKAQFLLGQYLEALSSLRHAKSAGCGTPEAAELAGDANYILGQYDAARVCYRNGLMRAGASARLESKLSVAEARSGGSIFRPWPSRRAPVGPVTTGNAPAS
jgi:tetratricopeptide (TPR) repeat protein